MRKLLILGIACTGVMLLLVLCAAQQPVRTDVIRLHILANSDSQTDQSQKLWVRDLVLHNWGEQLANLGDAETAWNNLGELTPAIEKDVAQALQTNGIAYGVSVRTGVFDFPDREYDGLDFPAGKYRALQIRLGAATGHNWWCVMFPPLCLVGADGNFDIEKYKQMLRDLEQQEDQKAAVKPRQTASAGRTTPRSQPKATAAPQAPVRSWIVDALGKAGEWDSSFLQWAKEFWLNGE